MSETFENFKFTFKKITPIFYYRSNTSNSFCMNYGRFNCTTSFSEYTWCEFVLHVGRMHRSRTKVKGRGRRWTERKDEVYIKTLFGSYKFSQEEHLPHFKKYHWNTFWTYFKRIIFCAFYCKTALCNREKALAGNWLEQLLQMSKCNEFLKLTTHRNEWRKRTNHDYNYSAYLINSEIKNK